MKEASWYRIRGFMNGKLYGHSSRDDDNPCVKSIEKEGYEDYKKGAKDWETVRRLCRMYNFDITLED